MALTARLTRNTSAAKAPKATKPFTRANTRNSPAATSKPTASISRAANGKNGGSVLRLTVKAQPNKLRQATSGLPVSATEATSIPPNPYADPPSESDATPQPTARPARSTRNSRVVLEPDSEEDDEDDDDAEDEEQDEEDAEGDATGEIDQELLENEDSDEEDGDGDDDEDEEMEDLPPPPVTKHTRPAGKNKPNVTVTAPQDGPLKSVEDKELDDEDEELSELDEDEDEDENADETEIGDGNGDKDEDEDDVSDDEDMSRSATPDLSKLTRRQRGAYEEHDGALMALSNEAQKKKHLTAEEHAMRRAEMARRRKNLSEKRNEEEKMDTINKLLKKPAPKRRTRAEIIAAQHLADSGTPGDWDGDEERPDALWTRYVQNRDGARLGVPEEWIEAPVGEVFRRSGGPAAARIVEEVA